MNKRWILAALCAAFLGLGGCAADETLEPGVRAEAGARARPYEVEYVYYSTASKTVQVGWKWLPCPGGIEQQGDVTPYYTKTMSACDDHGDSPDHETPGPQ